MMSVTVVIICIALLVAYATAIPGALLFLRGASLLSDAIGHSVLLGIAIMFLFVQSLTSIWLFIGAALAGLATVVLTEAIMQSNRLKHDAAIGVVFPCFFSIGVILISLYARNVHLDIDMVALGEIAFAPFYRLTMYGYDLGPHALWTSSIIGIVNTLFVVSFYKELKAVLFDNNFAHVIGLRPRYVYYCLMTLTSVTAVGAFEVVGSIVVVALMITPAATAYLMVRRFEHLMILAPVLGVMSALAGYAVARVADVSIAGSIAVVAGMIFAGVLLTAPYTGVFARWQSRKQYRKQAAQHIVSDYLRARDRKKATHAEIARDLNWKIDFVRNVVQEGVQNNVYHQSGNTVELSHAD